MVVYGSHVSPIYHLSRLEKNGEKGALGTEQERPLVSRWTIAPQTAPLGESVRKVVRRDLYIYLSNLTFQTVEDYNKKLHLTLTLFLSRMKLPRFCAVHYWPLLWIGNFVRS